MSNIFKPNGSLDISTDPTDLPDDGLTRCKNLRVDIQGKVSTRDGSSKFNAGAIETAIRHIVEQAGTRYAFAGTVIYEDESSIETGLADAAWKSILYNAYNDTTNQIFALNGTDRKRIEGSSVYEWGITAPSAAPVIGAGAGSALTGQYNAKITFCRKVGTTVVSESDPSPAAGTAVTLAAGSLSVSWDPSSDSQVTHVRVYRTAAGGGTYYHDQDIAIGTNKVDTSTTDANLGTEVATNHDRPPLGSFVFGPNYNGYCFILKDNYLYYCLAKRPEYWPATYFVEVSQPQYPGKCGLFYNGQPYVLTAVGIHFIQGTGHNSFFPLEMDAVTGCVNADAAISVAGMGILHVGTDGIYIFNGARDEKMSQGAFEPLFRGETSRGVPGISDITNCWLKQFKNKIYFGYTSSGYTYPSNVLVIDLVTQRVTYYDYGQEIRTVSIDKTNSYLLAGDNSGYVWRLEDDSETDDNGTSISWELESKEFTLQTRAHFPRWAKYDVDASDSDCSATGTLLLDGVSHQTHALTGDRTTKRRLVAGGNGERLSHRISGSGPVDIYAMESE